MWWSAVQVSGLANRHSDRQVHTFSETVGPFLRLSGPLLQSDQKRAARLAALEVAAAQRAEAQARMERAEKRRSRADRAYMVSCALKGSALAEGLRAGVHLPCSVSLGPLMPRHQAQPIR